MKPPSEMTNEELRIEIAEFCGWKLRFDLGTEFLYEPDGDYIGQKGFAYQSVTDVLPDYPQDLNAMWEAEQKLIYPVELWDRYLASLGEVCGVEFVHTLVHATAKQRAIAFVKTIREIKR